MGELGFPILFLLDPPQPAPNSLSRSPGEEGVWDPGESLTRGTESKRGKVSRREGGRVRNAAPNPRASDQALAPSERGGAIPDGQGFPPGEAGTPIPLSAPGVGGGLRNLLHSPLASHVQMNHLPGRPPTWDPLGCRRRGCHGPRASRLASTRFRVCTRAPPSPPAHWPGNSGAAGDWTKSSPVAVKFSASLKGLAFRVLDGTYRKAPLGKFSYKG